MRRVCITTIVISIAAVMLLLGGCGQQVTATLEDLAADNPEMVKAFIDCTYQPYVDRFAGQRGVMGIFSDEPQVSPRTDMAGGDAFMPYSPWMESAFEKRWGYPMRPHLASLVDTVGTPVYDVGTDRNWIQVKFKQKGKIRTGWIAASIVA